MAKPGLSNVTTTQTFQTWLDRTNDIINLLKTDVMTASALTDTTTGNSTLIGTFTANNMIAFDSLRVDTISPKAGSASTSFTSPISVSSSTSTAATVISANGPRINYSSGPVTWRVGFEDTTNNNFMIDTGVGARKLLVTPSGDLIIAGSIIAGGASPIQGNLTGNVTGDVTGNIFASNGTKILDSGNGTTIPATFTGNVVGNVTGTVSSIANHTTDALTEGPNNLYFTNARARASISAGTGVTYNSGTGVISIGQPVATTDNVTFANLNTTGTITSVGAIVSDGDITAFASSSDIRKKENIKKIDNALEKVLSIGGYTYNFIGDDRPVAGVIAQEIEKVLPEVVYEIDDEQFGKTKAVRYGNIVGLLIEAIKEIKSELDDLKGVK